MSFVNSSFSFGGSSTNESPFKFGKREEEERVYEPVNLEKQGQNKTKKSFGKMLGELKSFVECAICLEELKDPRVLYCNHTFCYTCIKKTRSTAFSFTTVCPLCREKHTDNNFKKNTLANQFISIIHEYSSFEEQPVCEEHSESVDCFCKTCDKTICHLCWIDEHKEHNATSISRYANEKRNGLIGMCEKINEKTSDLKIKQQNIQMEKQKKLDEIRKLQLEIENLENEDAEVQSRIDVIELTYQSLQNTIKETSDISIIQEEVYQQIENNISTIYFQLYKKKLNDHVESKIYNKTMYNEIRLDDIIVKVKDRNEKVKKEQEIDSSESSLLKNKTVAVHKIQNKRRIFDIVEKNGGISYESLRLSKKVNYLVVEDPTQERYRKCGKVGIIVVTENWINQFA